MIDTIKFAKDRLLIEIPANTPVWHWSNADSLHRIARIVKDGGSFDKFSKGAVGSGLYVSTSAVDLMDRGAEVFYAEIGMGSKALVIDPRLFDVGVPELFDLALRRRGWGYVKRTPVGKKMKNALSEDPPGMIDHLLRDIDIPCCVYCYGLHLAFMVRDSSCLLHDETVEPEATVIKYHMENPGEAPMLAPGRLRLWLENRLGQRTGSTGE